MALPTLEVHVPISPTRRFFNMVRCLALSLRRFGGRYRDASLIVTVGDDEVDTRIEEHEGWLRDLGVEVRWTPLEAFRRESWFATGVERFRYHFQSDVVLLLDADVLVAGPLEDLVLPVHRGQSFAGVIAHSTPFFDEVNRGVREEDIWQELAERAGLAQLDRPHRYTGEVRAVEDSCGVPAYFNFGVLCAPATLMNRVGEVMYPLMQRVDEYFDSRYRCQIALALAIAQLSIEHETLPPRFNFPTDRGFEELYPGEVADIRLVHLLGEGALNKQALFTSTESVRETISRCDLHGADEVARKVLAETFPRFETNAAERARPAAIESQAMDRQGAIQAPK